MKTITTVPKGAAGVEATVEVLAWADKLALVLREDAADAAVTTGKLIFERSIKQ